MITYHNDLIQGSDEWHKARCGLITASEVKLLLTPTLKQANNDKSRAHAHGLLEGRVRTALAQLRTGNPMAAQATLARALGETA